MKKNLFLSLFLAYSSAFGITNNQILQLYKNDAIADIEASKQRQADIYAIQDALNKLVANEFSAQRQRIARYDALMAQQIDKPKKMKKDKKEEVKK